MTAPFGCANFQSKEPRLLPDKEWVPQYFLKELAQPQPRHHRQPWPENRLVFPFPSSPEAGELSPAYRVAHPDLNPLS